MTKFFITCIMMPLCVINMTLAIGCQIAGPKQTVMEFSEALKRKDNKVLIPLVTNEPEYVNKRSFEEYLRVYPEVKRSSTLNVGQESQKVDIVTSGGRLKLRNEELVTDVVPTSLFFDQNMSVTRIISVRESGDEALVKAEFVGWEAESGNKYAPNIYDILLHREDGKWKIFMVKSRDEGDEKWYLYNFYANPDYTPPQ